jgi:hypothetical protein
MHETISCTVIQVDIDRLTIEESGRNLIEFAALLYPTALAGFLPLLWSRPIPPADNIENLGEYMDQRIDFMHYQTTIEEGLREAHEPPKR